MKYGSSLIINAPIAHVVDVWNNPDNYKHWQDGFQSIELLEGTANTVGAKSKILFKQGKGQMELFETILSIDLPHEKSGLYEHIHMTNVNTTKFKDLGNETTEYITEGEYTKFNGIIPKIMSVLFKGMFKKQSHKWMVQFKDYAEKSFQKK